MRSTSYTQEELENLRAEIAHVSEALPEDWYVALRDVQYSTLVFSFDFPGVPEVPDGVDKYLAVEYACVSPSTVPGFVNCDSLDEAYCFLTMVSERAASGDPIAYDRVLKCAQSIEWSGLQHAISNFVEGAGPDELPAEADGYPEWMDDLGELGEAQLITTVNWSNVYGSHGTIAQPESDPNALLVEIVFGDSEAEEELECHLEAFEIAPLEELLVRQLVCTNNTPYAYIRYSLMCGVFLAAVPENTEYLELAQTEGFLLYYEESKYQYGRGAINEREEAISRWLAAVEEGA